MNTAYATIALNDIGRAFRQFSLAWFLAWEDIRQRYVRTLLGPFWIVLSTGLWFSVMGFVMASLFHQDMREYLPFMVLGLLMWGLIAASISESATVLIMAAGLLTSFTIPIFTHYIRFILRNYIIFLHNVVILAIVLAIYPPNVTAATWLAVPGLLLDMLILLSVAVLLSLANLRYRDTHLAVLSALQILPFITPIFWNRGMLGQHQWIADINPFYHMIEIVRAPMVGQYPSPVSWMAVGGMAAGLSLTAFLLFVRYRHRIIFWL